MWAQLALAGLSALQNEQNRKQDIASNVITQKYSPWTGARADFSAQGKANGISTMMKGLGAGLAQDQADAKQEQMMKQMEEQKKLQEWNDDANYYAKLSKNPSLVGASPITQPSSPSRAPAATPAVSSMRSTMMDNFVGVPYAPSENVSNARKNILEQFGWGAANSGGNGNLWALLSKGGML